VETVMRPLPASHYKVIDGAGERSAQVEGGEGSYRILEAGESLTLDARRVASGRWSILWGARSFAVDIRRRGSSYEVQVGGRTYRFDLVDPDRSGGSGAGTGASGGGDVTTPMPGRVVRLLRAVGDPIRRGEGVVVVEAMKMENELEAPRDGVVLEVRVREGDRVEGGVVLAVIGDPNGAGSA
jgi:biotin carboxyl carrier protein